MVVPRTPRPPIIVPKPVERTPDPDEIERWLRRLARSIRLKRLEQGFLRRGGTQSGDAKADASGTDDGGAGRR
jgi:hypothetical protein